MALFFLVECGVFGKNVNNRGTVALLQLAGDVLGEEFASRNGQTVPGIEICNVGELVSELASLTRVGEDLKVAVAFPGLYERKDPCRLVVHEGRVADSTQSYFTLMPIPER